MFDHVGTYGSIVSSEGFDGGKAFRISDAIGGATGSFVFWNAGRLRESASPAKSRRRANSRRSSPWRNLVVVASDEIWFEMRVKDGGRQIIRRSGAIFSGLDGLA